MKYLASAAAFCALCACTPVAPSADEAASSSSVAMESSSQSSMTDYSMMKASSASSVAAVVETPKATSSAPASTAVRTVAIAATDWAFTPNVVKLKKGEKVQLVVTSEEGIHGFAAPSLRINEHVDLGQTVTVDIPTDTAGTFDFKCSVPCGPGHREMTGQIIIE